MCVGVAGRVGGTERLFLVQLVLNFSTGTELGKNINNNDNNKKQQQKTRSAQNIELADVIHERTQKIQ